MSNLQASRGHWLGLSVGATNLAATRDGQPAVIRPAEVTLRGMRLAGFVDRIGDPVPLIAPDGSTYHSEHLLAEALGAITHSVTEGAPVSDVTVTVPAHWRSPVVDTLGRSLGMPVVSDARAALTALRADPGLPTHGVIVLCDFGGSGTSITLADATSNDAPIGETVRVADFSGDHIDQALLVSVVAGHGSQADPYGTAMVGSLVRLRNECRDAKERLSSQTATAVAAHLPGFHWNIRVTRNELEDLMAAPLAAFLAQLDETLDRHRISPARVSAVATIGGGARVPLITQRLSEHLRAPVVTTPRPQLTAAEGAALIACRSRVVEVPTTLTPAPEEPSTAIRPLAWSQDTNAVDYDVVQADSRPELHFQHDEGQDHEPKRRGPLVLFGLSAVAAAVAAAVFGITLASDTTATPVDAAATTTVTTTSPPPAASAPPPAPAPHAPPVTTVVVQRPVNRAPQPRRQVPVTQQPPAAPAPAAPPAITTPPTTTTEPTSTTPPTTTTEPTTTTPAPPTSPEPPPIDPGPGDGGATDTPPIDPGPGDGTDTRTPPIDPGAGGPGTDTGGTTPTPEAELGQPT